MSSRNTSLIRQTLVSLIARFAGVGLNFIVIIILTRNLPVDEAGMMLFMMTLVTGFALFSRIGVEQWLVRDVAGLPDENLHASQSRYLRSSWHFLALSSVGFMVIWLAASPLMQTRFFDGEIHTGLLLLSALGIVFFNLVASNAAFMKGTHRITESLLTQNALPASTQLVLLLLLWSWFPLDQNYFWIYTLSLGLAAGFSILWLKPWWTNTSPQPAFSPTEVIRESLPLAPISWMAFLMLWADTLMTGLLLSNHEVALFSIAARLAFIVGIFLTALDATVYPRLLRTAKQSPEKLRPLFWQGTLLIAGIMFGSTALMALASKYLLEIFRPEYTAAASALLILLASQLVRGLSLTFSFMFIIQKQVSHLNLLLFSALVVNIIANLVLTPRYGIEGAASAGLIANLTLTGGVVVLFFQKRLLSDYD